MRCAVHFESGPVGHGEYADSRAEEPDAPRKQQDGGDGDGDSSRAPSFQLECAEGPCERARHNPGQLCKKRGGEYIRAGQGSALPARDTSTERRTVLRWFRYQPLLRPPALTLLLIFIFISLVDGIA